MTRLISILIIGIINKIKKVGDVCRVQALHLSSIARCPLLQGVFMFPDFNLVLGLVCADTGSGDKGP